MPGELLLDGVGELAAIDRRMVREEEPEGDQAIFVAREGFANEGVAGGDLAVEFGVAPEVFPHAGLAPEPPREDESGGRDKGDDEEVSARTRSVGL